MLPIRYDTGFPYNLYVDGIPLLARHPVYGEVIDEWLITKKVSTELIYSMIHACTEEDLDLRMTAVFVLGAIKSERATEMLLDLTADEDKYVRAVVAWALGNVPSLIVLERLNDFIEEETYPPAIAFALNSRMNVELYLLLSGTSEEASS